jgi:hypothetical protein
MHSSFAIAALLSAAFAVHDRGPGWRPLTLTEVLKPYLNAARWIRLAINPYGNLTAVFFTALEEDGVGVDEDLELEEPSEM